MKNQVIFRFTPIYKSVLWGGDRIAAYKGADLEMTHVGESWELSAVPGWESVVCAGECSGMTVTQLIGRYGAALLGEAVYARFGTQFPLLVKFIDARLDLSVQVHPDDEMAARRHGCMGKNEMWYIIDTEPGAKIAAGLSRTVTPREFARLVAEGEVMDVVAVHRSHPGDVFYLPAGRIHSIGAGNLLAEIQQTSDITYRVYDFDRRDAEGNLRELHVDLACEAIDYHVYDNYKQHFDSDAEGETSLVASPYFDVSQLVVKDAPQSLATNGAFRVVICVAGSVSLQAGSDAVSLTRGQTALVAAAAETVTFSGNASLLTATVNVNR